MQQTSTIQRQSKRGFCIICTPYYLKITLKDTQIYLDKNFLECEFKANDFHLNVIARTFTLN